MTMQPDDSLRPRKERKENADKRRRQVLDATCRSIVTNGLVKTTLATVAKEAGLSQGVAVFYFKSKSGLLTEALRDLYQSYEAHWSAAVDAAPEDPVSRLVALIRADFDPKICNQQTLSIWYAFWGEQAFVPQYSEITREYDENRGGAIRQACMDLLPDDPVRAANVADWIDTLTDGYWQNLHLFPANTDNEKSLAASLDCLKALLPEYAQEIATV